MLTTSGGGAAGPVLFATSEIARTFDWLHTQKIALCLNSFPIVHRVFWANFDSVCSEYTIHAYYVQKFNNKYKEKRQKYLTLSKSGDTQLQRIVLLK